MGMGSLDDYEASVTDQRAPLPPKPETLDFIRHATLAANGHNTQPWRFRVGPNRIDILPDLARRTPAVDPDDHHLFVSLGCASENLALACSAGGHPGEHQFDASQEGSISFQFSSGTPVSSALFKAIPVRQSSRTLYDGKPVSALDLQRLAAAAAIPGVDIVLLTERQYINQIRDLVIAANSVQMADPAFMSELKRWLRFNPRQAIRTGDGLFAATSGAPSLPSWLGAMAVDWMFKSGTETDKYAAQINSSAGITVFVAQREDHEHWVLAGRACQRFALQATALGIRHAFVNQPVEVASLRPDLANLIGLAGRRPDLVMRFGTGPAMPYSARRPVADVMLA